MKLLSAPEPPQPERVTIRETWIRADGRVYKFWGRQLMESWSESEAPVSFAHALVDHKLTPK